MENWGYCRSGLRLAGLRGEVWQDPSAGLWLPPLHTSAGSWPGRDVPPCLRDTPQTPGDSGWHWNSCCSLEHFGSWIAFVQFDKWLIRGQSFFLTPFGFWVSYKILKVTRNMLTKSTYLLRLYGWCSEHKAKVWKSSNNLKAVQKARDEQEILKSTYVMLKMSCALGPQYSCFWKVRYRGCPVVIYHI